MTDGIASNRTETTVKLNQVFTSKSTTLGPGTRQFLRDVAAADPRRTTRPGDVNWSEALPELRRHALLGLARAHLRAQSPEVSSPEVNRIIDEALAISALQMKAKYRAIRRILARLSAAGIDYLVVKGLAVAFTVYPNPALRLFSDVDIVAREADWTRIHQVLMDSGFISEEGWEKPVPKLIAEAVVQELKYWSESDHLLVEVHFEDLLYAGLAARDVQGFWDRSRFIEVEGLPVRVMSLEDQLVHLCAHLHYDGAKRLNWFSDIVIIIRDHADELDWQLVVDVARREEAQVPVYYALRYVSGFVGVEPPPGIMEALRPDWFRRWWHDRYVPEAGVLSLEPMAQPSLSFYHQPLFRRLLPDLLIMGRRGEKLRYLARLLAPNPAWLRHYYHLDPGRQLLPYYLLHPLKLLGHYLREIGKAFLYLYQEKRGLRHWAWWSFDP